MATKKKGSVKNTDTILVTSVNLAADVGATILPVANGGSGSGSFTDGQLLIGNTTGNTLTKAVPLGTTNQVVVTPGSGSLTFSLPQDIATSSSPQFAGLGIGGSVNTTTRGVDVTKNFTDPAATSVVLNFGSTSNSITSNNSQVITGIQGDVRLNQGSFNATSAIGVRGAQGNAFASGASGTVTGASCFVGQSGNTGAGTLTNCYFAYALSAANSGSGTLTNNHGYFCDVQTAGTNIYGFRGKIASGTNRWNLFMDGTATNHLAGNTSIGSTTTTSLFNVGSAAQTQINSSGLLVNYNNIATVSNGIPSELATVDLTAQTANIGATTLYAVPASGAGMYRVSALVVETTAGSISSTLPNVQIVYTDNQTAGAVTIDATPVLGVAGIGQTGALTANTVGTTSCGVIVINAKASTNIQYQTVNYQSSLAGMTYAIHVKLEAM